MAVKLIDLLNIREQIQEDLLCLLDEQPEELKTAACQIVVDQFKRLDEWSKLPF